MRKFPYLIFVVVLFVIVIGGAAVYSLRGDDGVATTPVPGELAAAEATNVAPMSLPTLAETVPAATDGATSTPLTEAMPVATETARVVATFAPPATTVPPATETPRVVATVAVVQTGVASSLVPLPTSTPVSSLSSTGDSVGGADAVPAETPLSSTDESAGASLDMPADTSLVDLPGEPTELPIVMINPVREMNLGAFPNVQTPSEPVGPDELYVAHGDIYGTGQCFVHVFQPGEQVSGLAAATWWLVHITGGVPAQREELIHEVQLEAALDPSADSSGSCPFG